MNNYQQIKVLGEGGFGKAILVRQRSTGNMCVIKEVRLSALSQRDRNEATKEAKVLASLKHPNIVNYINSFQERGCFYIVMEYCDGGDLAKKIAGRGSVLFSEDEILHYFIQVSLAIKYIHDRKILHRDLKAQNIFLTKDGTAKLGDFGIARVLERTFQLCRTQIGTPYYLSPEICEGKNYDSKTDIWSLGCILYELCTLKRAFDGCNQRGLMMKIVQGKYAPISSKYSQDLRNLVDSMLTKEASKRPTINEILKRPFIQNRLSSMLEKTILDYEFSHTIIHGRKPFAAPTVLINKSSSENNYQKPQEKDNQMQFKKQASDPPQQNKNNDRNRPTSEQRLINQEFLKEQQKRQQQQQQQQYNQYQQKQRQPQNFPANVDPRYARRNFDIYGNARNPKQTEEQERERQRQIEELKRKHQQDENDRRAREQKQQEFQQQLEQERAKRAKQREIEEYKRIAAERDHQKYRLEQQKKELEEMKRLAAEQNRLEEEKRRAVKEELRRQEEEYRKRREEAKKIMRNHEKEEERKQAEELERKRIEEVERKRKEVEEMVKKRQAEADELKRIQEQKRKERMIEQQRERDKLEQERLRMAEEEKAKRRAIAQRQRELREIQKKDLEDKRKRQLHDLQQNAIINNNNRNNQVKQTKNQTFIDNNNNNNNDDLRGGFNYNDPFDPLEQTTADVFISKISQDGPAWAKMPQKRIPISLDQTIRVSDDEDDDTINNNSNEELDEFASVQKDDFFDSIRSGTIKNSTKDTPSWARSKTNKIDNDDDQTDDFVNETLLSSIVDTIPRWAKQNNNNNQQKVDSSSDRKITKQSSTPSSRLIPERFNKVDNIDNDKDKYINEDEDEPPDDDEVGKEVDLQMSKKFKEEDDNKLTSLHDLAMSIKQALDIPDEPENDIKNKVKEESSPSSNEKEEQIFYMNDEQIRLPVANDKTSHVKRQDAIRTFLEEKIGAETLIALNEELIHKEADDNVATPIISNLPPGIVCLAQQWLMLDSTFKDQN